MNLFFFYFFAVKKVILATNLSLICMIFNFSLVNITVFFFFFIVLFFFIESLG